MPITEALKKLIKTITGKDAVGETIEELIRNLNENYPEGGGKDNYETVLEIPLTTEMLVVEEGVRIWDTNVEATLLPESQELFFNSAEYPLTWNEDDDLYEYNFNLEKEGFKDDSSKPLFVVRVYKDERDDEFISVISTEDDPDLTGTTVKILKKVSGGGSNGSLVVTLTPTEEENRYTADTDTSDIIRAFEQNIPVFVKGGAICAHVFYAYDGMVQACLTVPAEVTSGNIFKSVGIGLFQSLSQREWQLARFEYAVNEIFTIHYTIDTQTGTITSTEKAGEAYAAAERGATIISKCYLDNTYYWSMALYLQKTNDNRYIAYCVTSHNAQPAIVRLDAASANDVFTGQIPT